MPRRLVTLRQVTSIEPIPGADRVVAAHVGGWTCVVPAGDFTTGALGLFFEIDSFLPASDPRWEYLRPSFSTNANGAQGFRARSQKIRGRLSQGFLLPLDADKFPEIQKVLERRYAHTAIATSPASVSIDDKDASSTGPNAPGAAGRLATEAETDSFEDAAGGFLGDGFPSFVPQTEQERVQNLGDKVLGDWADRLFQETTKMDGSSMTVYFVRKDGPHYASLPRYPEGRVGVCSRIRGLVEPPEPETPIPHLHVPPPLFEQSLTSRDPLAESPAAAAAPAEAEAETPSTASKPNKSKKPKKPKAPKPKFVPSGPFWAVVRAFALPESLGSMGFSVAVQGELVDSTVQSNAEGFPPGHHDFYVFSAWDNDEQRALPPREVEKLARGLGLRHVPVVGYARMRDLAVDVDGLLERAEGEGVNGGGRLREGIVLKEAEEGKLSFKAIENSYLLKRGE